jgi:LAS superfamily LD-carboxypeptidase LdcB
MKGLHLLAAAVLACASLVLPVTGFGAGAARAMGPLPACRYDDILTTPRRYVEWSVTLVDPILRVPSTYTPPDLVPTGEAGLSGGGTVRAIVIDDLRAMADAARAAGAPIAVASAYRSYAQQKITFQNWINALGYRKALQVSARPGHSEHQLGVAIDFKSEPGGAPWNGVDWATTAAGSWMKANAWQYGWILSYPRNDLSIVCYAYEPWHYRYVGRDLAAKIHQSGVTTRAYLWANDTTAIVPPLARGTPAPPATASPAPSPAATSEPSIAPTDTPLPTPTATTSPAASEAPVPAVPSGPATRLGPLDSTGVAVLIVAIGAIVVVGGGLVFTSRRRGFR